MYKKNKAKFLTAISLFLSLVIPQMTLASSISLRSVAKTIEPTKTFSISVYVDPKSVASYTAQANITFPIDLVSVESFTYASSWFPLTQSGLDAIDNTSGKLIKTAGYPNGFSQETLLGTMVVKSKKAGSIVLSTNKDSYVLDIDSNNTLNTYGSFSITSGSVVVPTAPVVTTPVVTTTPKTTTTTTTPKTTTKTTPKTETTVTPVVTTTEDATKTTETNPNTVVKEKPDSKKIILILGIIVGAISAYFGLR